MSSAKQAAFDYIKREQFEDALRILDALVLKKTRDAEIWFMHGAIHAHLKNSEQAKQSTLKSLELDPENLNARYNLAQLYMHEKKYDLAIDEYKQLLRRAPANSAIKTNINYALNELGRYQEAVELWSKAELIQLNDSEGLINFAVSFFGLGEADNALKLLQRALKLEPVNPKALSLSGSIYESKGDYDQALTCFRSALEYDPHSMDARTGIALINIKQGDYSQAYAQVSHYVEKGEEIPVPYAFVLSRLYKHIDNKDVVRKALTVISERADSSSTDRVMAHFELGKILERERQYNEAFTHFKLANEQKVKNIRMHDHTKEFEVIIKTFNANLIDSHPRSSDPGDDLCFIVGMPRSGTSLIEQILSMHPDVCACGELDYMSKIINEFQSKYGGGMHAAIHNATSSELNDMANMYRKCITKNVKGRYRIITDKMPHNFLALGYIQLIFSNAKVIYCSRNPLDTCLSIYTCNFSANHAYGFKLKTLGEYYKKHVDLMAHWKNVLKLDIHQISYEAVVSDLEKEARKLIEYCGLPWDDRCLNFHKSDRITKTPSYEQVRQPIYRSSVGKWENYEQHLGELKSALDGL